MKARTEKKIYKTKDIDYIKLIFEYNGKRIGKLLPTSMFEVLENVSDIEERSLEIGLSGKYIRAILREFFNKQVDWDSPVPASKKPIISIK